MVLIKTPEEIEIMAEGGKILARIIKELEKMVRLRITTKELDRVAETLVLNCGGQCSFKGYENFPACLCSSINEEVVHAVPSERKLKQGDIISLDLGLFWKGFHTDMAITVPVGKISAKADRLIKVTKKSLEIGVEKVKLGNCFGDISRAIQKYVEGQGFNVVRELCGHGIGKEIHEAPQILNSVSLDKALVDKVKYTDDATIKIKEGMVFCLEPMLAAGDWHLKKSVDGFGLETKDGSLSAHFEHTIVVAKNGYRVLTKI